MNNRSYLYFLVIFIFSLSNCKTDDCQVVETYDNKKRKVTICNLNEQLKTYSLRLYRKSGSLEEEFWLKNDELNGEAKEYYESGEVKAVRHYNDNILDGDETIYYRDGNIKSKTFYEKGIKQNEQIVYSEKGEVVQYKYFFFGEMVYKNDSIGQEGFFPILKFTQDTLDYKNTLLEFEVWLPIPDSLINKRKLVYAYQMKPLSLRDSVIAYPEHKILLNNEKSIHCKLKLSEQTTQLFYGHVFDEKEKHIFYPFEKLVVFKNKTG